MERLRFRRFVGGESRWGWEVVFKSNEEEGLVELEWDGAFLTTEGRYHWRNHELRVECGDFELNAGAALEGMAITWMKGNVMGIDQCVWKVKRQGTESLLDFLSELTGRFEETRSEDGNRTKEVVRFELLVEAPRRMHLSHLLHDVSTIPPSEPWGQEGTFTRKKSCFDDHAGGLVREDSKLTQEGTKSGEEVEREVPIFASEVVEDIDSENGNVTSSPEVERSVRQTKMIVKQMDSVGKQRDLPQRLPACPQREGAFACKQGAFAVKQVAKPPRQIVKTVKEGTKVVRTSREQKRRSNKQGQKYESINKTRVVNACTQEVERGRLNHFFLNRLASQWHGLAEEGKNLLLRLSLLPGSFPLEVAGYLNDDGANAISTMKDLSKMNLLLIDPHSARCNLHESMRGMLRSKVEEAGLSLAKERKIAAQYFTDQLARIENFGQMDTMYHYLQAQQMFVDDEHNFLFAFEASYNHDMDLYRRLCVIGGYTIRYMLKPQARVEIFRRMRGRQKDDDRLPENAEDAALITYVGRAYLDEHMYREAESCFFRVIDFYRKRAEECPSDRKNLTRLAQTLQNLAQTRSALEDHVKAVELNMEALKIRQKQNNSIPLAVNMGCMASCLFAMGRNDDAEKLLIAQLRILDSQQMTKTSECAKSLHLLGMIYLARGELEMAKTSCESALDCSSNSKLLMQNHSKLEGTIHLGLGKVYEAFGDIENALKKYRLSLRCLTASGLRSHSSANIVNTGISRCKQNIYRSKIRGGNTAALAGSK